MSALSLVFLVPFFVIGTVLTALLWGFGVRRLLGLRLPLLRTLIAGILAFLVAPPIITAIIPAGGTRQGILPDLWFVILGAAIGLLVGMRFRVVAVAFVPAGSLAGSLYIVRRLRKLLGRTKRYWEIIRILGRRGRFPYLRGARRAE